MVRVNRQGFLILQVYLMALMKPEDIVLLKGSNGMKLSEVVNILTN